VVKTAIAKTSYHRHASEYSGSLLTGPREIGSCCQRTCEQIFVSGLQETPVRLCNGTNSIRD